MTSMNSTYESIEYKCGDRIARITLNRPEKRNALSGHMRPGAGDFARISREEGLKAAIEWRDATFKAEGL